MTDDLLTRATQALRDRTAEPELRSGLTRARLLDNAAKQRQKRWLRIRVIAPFILTLGAGSALARFTHEYYPEVWNAIVPTALEAPVPEPHLAQAHNKRPHPPHAVATRKPSLPLTPAPAPALTPTPAPAPALPLAPAPAPALPLAPAPAPAHSPHAHPRRLPPSAEPNPRAAEPASAPAAESAELSLFRRAMHLQDAHSPTAVAAWDDFLRVAPEHPLALEARYNRALALVRAGRAAEARAALLPFANGDFKGFRAHEARELLAALQHKIDASVPQR